MQNREICLQQQLQRMNHNKSDLKVGYRLAAYSVHPSRPSFVGILNSRKNSSGPQDILSQQLLLQN